jgi:uncharacterized small protein (DUF1192 family)
MFDDDDAPKKPKTHEVGMKLDTLSVDELKARIELLEAEIARLKQAIEAKTASRATAEGFFRK